MIDFSKVNYTCTDNGFVICFGTKAIKTYAQNEMVAPSEIMAKAIVDEWQLLENEIDWSKLPLSKHLGAVLDNADSVDKWREELKEFSKSDLLYYFSDSPKELREQQESVWLPILSQFNNELGVELKTTVGVMPIKQNLQDIEKISKKIANYNIFEIFMLRNFAGFLGSFILAYAVFNNWKSFEDIYLSSIVDELWQEKHWGQDLEETERRKKIQEEFTSSYKFFKLISAEN